MTAKATNSGWMSCCITGLVCAFVAAGCASTSSNDHMTVRRNQDVHGTTQAGGGSGASGKYVDAGDESAMPTVGIESNDIVSACDTMVRRMLAEKLLFEQVAPPQVMVDGTLITNETSEYLNVNLLADRLRSELLRAANRRMVFVGREHFDRITRERALKEEGIVGEGTTGRTKKQLGLDYELHVRLTDQQVQSAREKERYTQMVFEMVDMESGEIVFSDIYSFKKRTLVPAAYR